MRQRRESKARAFLLFRFPEYFSLQGMGTEKFTDKPDGGQDKKYPKTVMETILKVN